MPETPYIEANALLAMQQGDWDGVREMLKGLLPGELSTLDRACECLADECRRERIRQRLAASHD